MRCVNLEYWCLGSTFSNRADKAIDIKGR